MQLVDDKSRKGSQVETEKKEKNTLEMPDERNQGGKSELKLSPEVRQPTIVKDSEQPELLAMENENQNQKMIELYKHSKYDGIFKNVLESNPRSMYGGNYSTKRQLEQKLVNKKSTGSMNSMKSNCGRSSAMSNEDITVNINKSGEKILSEIEKQLKNKAGGPDYGLMNPKNELNMYFKQLQQLNNRHQSDLDRFLKDIKRTSPAKQIKATEVKITTEMTLDDNLFERQFILNTFGSFKHDKVKITEKKFYSTD